MGLTPELRKAIEEKAEARAIAEAVKPDDFESHIRQDFIAGAEACFEIMQIDQWAFENLTRKLNEANARIVEFDHIKAGHMKVQSELQAEIDRLREALRIALKDGVFFTKFHTKSKIEAALKDPGGV